MAIHDILITGKYYTKWIPILMGIIFFLFPFNIQIASSQLGNITYKNEKYKIAFTIPPRLSLFTSENPGPLTHLFERDTLLYMVNQDHSLENISVAIIENISDSDVVEYKSLIEKSSSTHHKYFQNYKRISVEIIKIGMLNYKSAVNHIYLMTQYGVLGKFRQVSFAHRGKGFLFTCGADIESFDNANEEAFKLIFRSMKFE